MSTTQDVTDYRPVIDGEPADVLTEWIEVEAPATKRTFARIPRGGAAEVDAAVRSADAAFQTWSQVSARDRGAALHAIARELDEHREHLAQLISQETGNAIRTQSRGEMGLVVDVFTYFAGLAREVKGTTSYLMSDTLDFTVREPFGVVGAIVPWNAPALIAAVKIAPALVTGNTVVIKPSEDAPLAVLELVRLCNRHLPPGVLNSVTGLGIEAGAALAEHPSVRKVSFTGSTAVGKRIQRVCADRLARVTLELGGKSPQIVFPDVDVEATVAEVITAMRFSRQGQSCTAGTRLFVHEDVADEFVAALSATLSHWRVGNPLADDTDAGAIVNERQFNRVNEYIAGALERHPEALVLGGTANSDAEGYFMPPTLFRDLPDDDPLVQQEVFGPVLAISTWRHEDDVVRRANDTEYGLAAYVYANDSGTALRMAHRIKAGWVQVNQGRTQGPGQAFGGMKQSGSGREFSLEGMLESFTEVKHVSVSMRGTGGQL